MDVLVAILKVFNSDRHIYLGSQIVNTKESTLVVLTLFSADFAIGGLLDLFA